MAVFDPHRIHTPWLITKKFGTGDYVGGPYGCDKFGANPSNGGFWANGQTRRRIFTLDGSNDADSRKDVPFGGLVDNAAHFGGEIPRKPHFWDVNMRFQAKRAKYWKFHFVETTASISTKFCKTIETIKKSSRVVPAGAQQIQDGGRPPFWNNR